MGCNHGNNYFDNQLVQTSYCQCKKVKCNCNQKVSHRVQVQCEMKKDFMKTEWVIPKGKTQPVFQNGGFNELIGSGFISYDSGSSPFIIVRFFLNGALQGPEIHVFHDSSVAFTYTTFNQVTITCPGQQTTDDVNNSHQKCMGELNIVARYPVFC